MSRKMLLAGITCAVMCVCLMHGGSSSVQTQTNASQVQFATGVVFHDANGNRQRDAGEPGLADIRVSNGTEIITTDKEGHYRLPVSEDAIVFVIKPRGWRTPFNENMWPRFYYIHKPHGSPNLRYPGVAPTGPLPASIDFPLSPQEEPTKFQAVIFGDTQPRNQKEIDYLAHDVIEDLIGTQASFGVTLGDIVNDELNLMEPLGRTIALLGIPWYNIIGNHDINRDARTRRENNETYERNYGPSYYSFDYGPVHFLALDDIDWVYDDEKEVGHYQPGFGPDQLAFIKRDLEMIPADQMVVLMMHIPLTSVPDREEVYRLIEQRPFCLSLAAHAHHHEHRFITAADGWRGPQPHHHIINVTACGSTFKGEPDERGIPHAIMSDGAPNGYSLLEFDGHEYRMEYVPAGRPRDYQMQIHAPEKIAQTNSGEVEILVNVFNGSARSRVEFRVGNQDWIVMQKKAVADPALVATYEREKQLLESKKDAWLLAQKPGTSPHIWSGMLPAGLPVGTHAIEVRTQDMFGAIHHGRRVIRVE